MPEFRIRFHDGSRGKAGKLSDIGKIHVRGQLAQTQQGFDLLHAFLPGGCQGLAHVIPQGAGLFAPLQPPVIRRADHPPAMQFIIAGQVPWDEFHQMPIPRRAQGIEAAQQIVSNQALVGEPLALLTSQFRLRLPAAEKGFLPDHRAQSGHQVVPLPGDLGGPGEMINPGNIEFDFLPRGTIDFKPILHQRSQLALGSKNLMAATEDLHGRCRCLEGRRADRHRVSIIDDPSLRAKFHDRMGEMLKERNAPEGTQDAAGPGGIAHRLQDAVLRRDFQIGAAKTGRPGLD